MNNMPEVETIHIPGVGEVTAAAVEKLSAGVDRGASMLDHILTGWHKALNMRLLDLAEGSGSSGKGCVLCQLDHYLEGEERLPRSPIPQENFGDFTAGVNYFQALLEDENLLEEDDDADPEDYGFEYRADLDRSGSLPVGKQYKILDHLWTEQVNKRMAHS